MKTKLLKKVRKKYNIIKITDLPYNLGITNLYLTKLRNEHGLPFYLVIDNSFLSTDPYLYGSKDLNSCKTFIVEEVNKKYYDTIKKSSFKYYKVWG